MKWQEKEYPKPHGICILGGYDLHLYCANEDHEYGKGDAEYAGINWLECVMQARRDKWRLDFKKDLAICHDWWRSRFSDWIGEKYRGEIPFEKSKAIELSWSTVWTRYGDKMTRMGRSNKNE